MVSVKDVPADIFIDELTKYIKENIKEVKPPEWAFYVKTGPSRQRPPDNPDWWYIRAASILRKLYLHGPLSIEDLRSMYGGRKDKGVKPEHFYKGGGSNIRKILQQLEAAGLVTKTKDGRILTSKGRSLLDKLAAKIRRQLDIKPWYEAYG
ncbi:30S ribosomal protein S19e [Candidatus Geothermarchaeota archaeon]|nr:MAG: 30S ribosomal protein S19e [Candidatus Geothermarchaeota archaeon]